MPGWASSIHVTVSLNADRDIPLSSIKERGRVDMDEIPSLIKRHTVQVRNTAPKLHSMRADLQRSSRPCETCKAGDNKASETA